MNNLFKIIDAVYENEYTYIYKCKTPGANKGGTAYTMNLFNLRYFVTLAHVQHNTKAAQQLCITQPSLSHAITQMEKELGVPLFEKTGRNTTLTRFGEEFLECAQHTLSILDEGIASIKRSSRGEGLIRLGLLRPLGVEFVPRLASLFLAQHPDKDIQFTFHTGVTKQLTDGMVARKYDLLFCSEPPAELKFTAVPVKRQDLVLIVPKKHPLASKHTIDLADTISYPYIFFEKSSGIRNVIDEMFLRVKGEPQIAYETEEDQVIAGMVSQGFGIAVVPYMDLLLKLDLKILQISSPDYERNFFLVSNDSVYMPPAVEQFRDFVLNNTKM